MVRAPALTQKSCGPSTWAHPREEPLGHLTSGPVCASVEATPQGVSARTAAVRFPVGSRGSERTQPLESSSTNSRSTPGSTRTACSRDGWLNKAVWAGPSR